MAEAPFADRTHAGRVLAEKLRQYAGRDDAIVLALPRGGVPVGYEVAEALDLPLDLFLVRKLGVPGHEELAMGAIASGGTRVLNDSVVESLEIPESSIRRVEALERVELERREREYRHDTPAPEVRGKVVILIDDGLATGATMRAAVQALRQQGPAKVVVAVPVAALESCQMMRAEADEVLCALTPEPFHAVGVWYETFSQTDDDEVRDLLRRAWEKHPVTHGQEERG